MMKKLLLLALIAVAREATAEEAKCVREHVAMVETIILDNSEQYLRAREAEAMCDHAWIFEARTLSTQPVRRRCGMCGVYRMEPRCREPGYMAQPLWGWLTKVMIAGKHGQFSGT